MKIRLVLAKKEDLKRVWNWRNNKETRRNFLHKKLVPLATHKKWFAKALENGSRKIYMITTPSGLKLGAVWFDLNSYCKQAEIGINLAPNARRQGLGTEALELASKKAFDEWGIDKICAQIKMDNFGSQRAFYKAGYDEVGVIVERYKN